MPWYLLMRRASGDSDDREARNVCLPSGDPDEEALERARLKRSREKARARRLAEEKGERQCNGLTT
jgi:hypothetical protein